MKKYIGLFVAVLLLGSVTVSQAFFGIADPLTTNGAAYVLVPVHNNSGAALDTGDVVVWDIDASTGDDDLYVTTTTTADTGLVAGVVYSAIGIADEGMIVVYGFAQCDVGSAGVAAGGLLCTSSTAVGDGDSCVSTNGSGSYAVAGVAGGSTQINCFVQLK